MSKQYYVAETPGGTLLWDLRANTEDKAWKKLLNHAPYPSKEALIERGYTVSLFKVAQQ